VVAPQAPGTIGRNLIAKAPRIVVKATQNDIVRLQEILKSSANDHPPEDPGKLIPPEKRTRRERDLPTLAEDPLYLIGTNLRVILVNHHHVHLQVQEYPEVILPKETEVAEHQEETSIDLERLTRKVRDRLLLLLVRIPSRLRD